MYWNIINLPDRDPDPYPPELYWSSTESRANTAMGVDFNDGHIFYAGKQINRPNIRAIRAF